MGLPIVGVIAVLGAGMLFTRLIDGERFHHPGVQTYVTSFGVGLSVVIILFLMLS